MARSLAVLRGSGFIACPVERFIHQAGAGIRRDCFGWADLLAAHPVRRQVVLCQVTTRGHLAHRIAKAKGRPELTSWLAAGGLAWFHGWYQRGGRWHCHMVEVVEEQLRAVVVSPPRRRRGKRVTQRGLFDEGEPTT